MGAATGEGGALHCFALLCLALRFLAKVLVFNVGMHGMQAFFVCFILQMFMFYCFLSFFCSE